MKKLFLLPFAVMLFGCLPGQEPKQIIVDGQGSIEVEPEIFNLEGNIRSRQQSREAVLRDISSKMAAVHEKLPALVGITNLSLNASEVTISPIQDYECIEQSRYRSEEGCPVTGFYGSISVTVKGSPAQLSGSAFSLLSELGAEGVTLSSYTLADMNAAKERAIEAAVQNARAKAEKIAASSGSAVVGVIRIQYGEGFSMQRGYYAEAAYAPQMEVRSPETAVTPQIEFALEPQPIKISEDIVAAFAIE